ncbi:GTP 3',8-cyclase MoaA [Roseateles sp. BYS180W]|uniref:GTP 3',8-cyclase n=1 Tax=Roseateles rivi TaxID=3299028 RepID=A0ABW7FY79_9BURK
MSDRVIPLYREPLPQRRVEVPEELPGQPRASSSNWQDALARPLRDLRISVTDRCNFRCGYCMPKEVFDKSHRFLPHAELLSFEEITRLARVFVAHGGVRKLRITGGEPLLRKNIEELIAMLARLRTPDGEPLDLTLTTNGSLLARKAEALKAAGLQRITVSLDALDDAVFQRMNDVQYPVAEVLAGIEAARRAGLNPIKINMVVQRGVNDQDIVPMARHFLGSGAVLRFIEFMDVGSSNGWRMDQVLPSDEVLQRLQAHFTLTPLPPSAEGETAQRWRYADGEGELGLISSVTHAFCGDCNRARLSTEGVLYTCLFANRGHDLRALLRDPKGYSDAQIAAALAALWARRADRYSELRGTAEAQRDGSQRIEMHYIGG